MANPYFSEIPVKEYSSFPRKDSDQSETRIRVRLVKRKDFNGPVRLFIDIRKYACDEKGSLFTRQGVYFYPEEIDVLVKSLLQAKQDIHGTN